MKKEIKVWGSKRELTQEEIELINLRINEIGVKKDILAKKSNMTNAQFSRVINGHRLVSENEIDRIAYALNLYSSVK